MPRQRQNTRHPRVAVDVVGAAVSGEEPPIGLQPLLDSGSVRLHRADTCTSQVQVATLSWSVHSTEYLGGSVRDARQVRKRDAVGTDLTVNGCG